MAITLGSIGFTTTLKSGITGPHSKTESSQAKGFYRKRDWFRQPRPYVKPLTYDFRQHVLRTVNRNGTNYLPEASMPSYLQPSEYPPSHAHRVLATNKAYAKFVDAVRASSSLSLTIAERKQAMDMITKRLIQMWNFLRALRKGRLGDAAKQLGINVSKVPRRKSSVTKRVKTFGELVIEFNFGWAPLVGDIEDAIAVLSRDFETRAKATGVASFQTSYVPFDKYDGKRALRNYRIGVSMRADLRVTNPNLTLAQELGFINPSVVLWELVPFSFVVDKFVNIQQFLSAGSDFMGLELIDPHTTTRFQGDYSEWHVWPSSYAGASCTVDVVWLERRLGISKPVLRFVPFPALHWRTGLTWASLVVQALKG